LKRRLYRYKYVRRIDDKLPTVEQLRDKVKQQEDDAYFFDHGVDPDGSRHRAARFTSGSGIFTRSVEELEKSLTASPLRQTVSDFRSSAESRSTSTSWVQRSEAARRRVDEDYLSRCRAVSKSKAKKSAQLKRHLDDVKMAARQPSMAEVRKILAMHWFVYASIVHFLHRGSEALEYSHMSKDELIELVKRGEAPDHLTDNRQIQFAKNITRIEEEFSNVTDRAIETILMIQLTSRCRATRRKRRDAAQCVYKCVSAWASSGQLVMTVRSFHMKSRKVQAFWRHARKRIAAAESETEHRWHMFEEELCTELVTAWR
jgi:hypothetical protein